MWRVLGLVLCSCRGAQIEPVAPRSIENRGGAASTSCTSPARRLEFEARRYGNLDADSPDYQTWSAWRVGIQLADATHGTLSMVGDDLVWTFDVAGKQTECALELWTDTHEPFRVRLDLRARTGTISSIDDVWLLGPPFPPRR